MIDTPEVSSGESGAAARDPENAPSMTLDVLANGMLGGFVGMVVMLPLLVGVPVLLGVFRTEPIARFVPLVDQFGIEPTFAMGIALFIAGGTVMLPMVFVVVAPLLPPDRPLFLRGVAFATIFWTGFVLAFWPGGGIPTNGTFIVVSVLAHWLYGAVMAGVLERRVGIPDHDM